jgi:N-dimethylarginine dimethylaminohydrolase
MTKTYDAPYVRSDAGALAGAIVCAPSAAIDRLPPLASEPSPIASRALEAHGVLVGTLRDRGVDVTVMAPVTEEAAESLVADYVLMLPQGALIARPSAMERRVNVAAVERAVVALGIPVIGRIAAPGLLDATDVVLAGDRAYVGVPRPGAGLRPRSNELGRRQLATLLEAANIRVIELATAPQVSRLRNAFNLVASDIAIAAAEHVDLVPVTGLQIVEVVRGEEAAAGVLAFGERRAIVNLRFRESIRLLRAANVSVEAIDLWEFGKAGVGPFQLVLPTKRG